MALVLRLADLHRAKPQATLPDFLPCTQHTTALRTNAQERCSLAASLRGTSGQVLPRRPCTALRRGASRTDCAAQHAGAKRTCEPGLLGASNDDRSLSIATRTSPHGHAACKTHGWMMQTLHWGLTFDMSGGTKAQPLGRPLDGGVSPQTARRGYGLAAGTGNTRSCVAARPLTNRPAQTETAGPCCWTCRPAHAAPRTHPRRRSSHAPSIRRTVRKARWRRQCAALRRGAP